MYLQFNKFKFQIKIRILKNKVVHGFVIHLLVTDSHLYNIKHFSILFCNFRA